jgi:hypothetical protein
MLEVNKNFRNQLKIGGKCGKSMKWAGGILSPLLGKIG